jgi:preprotein translocase subunit SecA
MNDLVTRHENQQPILVGTTSVEKSDLVSRLLKQKGIPHNVLNAKQHLNEAQIVALAGRLGAVTVSTNMAGRGTDIKLGGDPEILAKGEIDPSDEGYQQILEKYTQQCSEEREKVLAAGGLHILGTERHESRRIDNQLRGRAGRQGDPGSSTFFLCLEDDLLRIFGSDKLIGWMERMGMKDDEPIEHRWVTKQIESAQKKVEGHNFNIRKNLLEYDDVMNLQRKTIYSLRKQAVLGEDVRGMIDTAITSLTDDIIEECMDPTVHPEEWHLEEMRDHCSRIFDFEWEETDAEIRDMAYLQIRQKIFGTATELFASKEEEIGSDVIRELERKMLLHHTDQHWKDHLLAMDRLRHGVSLRGYGQQNPLLEYKREGTEMFMLMCSLRDEAILSNLLRFSPEMMMPSVKTSRSATQQMLDAINDDGAENETPISTPVITRPQAPAPKPVQRPKKGIEAKKYAELNGIQKRDPCPCGSGTKYKKCCMNRTEEGMA